MIDTDISVGAHVHPKADLGQGVIVSPGAVVEADVRIGDGTWVGPNAVIMSGTTIGARCKVFPSAVVGADPQDLKYAGEKTEAIIGNDTVIRECVTINRGTTDRMKTVVGNSCLLMAYVHLAHDVVVGNHCILANAVNIAGHVVIEDHAILEGLVAVQQFVRIGKHSFIAGGSMVRKNVPPYVKAAREPLSYIGVNSIGLKRRGFDEKTVLQIEDIYRTIYVYNNNVTRALGFVDAEVPECREKTEILEFIRASENGIMRGSS